MAAALQETVRVTVAILGADSSEPFFDGDWSGSSLHNDFEGEVGLGFVARSTFVITALGRYVESVLRAAATLTLWDVETQQALCEVIVGPTSPKESSYAYEQVFPRVVARAGKEYRLTQRCEVEMLDVWPDQQVSPEEMAANPISKYARFLGGFYNFSGGYPSFVDQTVGQRAGMVNFKISPGIAVFTLHPGTIVYKLKCEVEDVTGVSPAQQRLSLDGNVLNDNLSLVASGVDDGSLVMLAIRPGAVVATVSDDGLPRLWDIEDGRCLHILQGHIGPVNVVEFSPSGGYLATGGEDCAARIWSAEDGQCIRTLFGHSGPITSASFSPTGAWVLTASRDSSARLWDADSGSCLSTLCGHTGALSCAVFSADGAFVATASADGTVGYWRSETGERVRMVTCHDGSVRTICFSLSGALVLTIGIDAKAPVKIWNFEDAECIVVLSPGLQVHSASFSRDGNSVVAACTDHTARIWHVGTLEERLDVATEPSHRVMQHDVQVVSACFSLDGSLVAAYCADFTIWLWEVHDCVRVHVLSGHSLAISAMIYSPDGSFLTTASQDCTAKVWSLVSGECVRTLSGHTAPLNSVAVSP